MEKKKNLTDRCEMFESGRPVDEPTGVVSNFLKPVKKVFSGAKKKSIAIV